MTGTVEPMMVFADAGRRTCVLFEAINKIGGRARACVEVIVAQRLEGG